MNVFIPENPTVKVYMDPEGRAMAKTNILDSVNVEIVPVLKLDELSNQRDGMPFVVGVNERMVGFI